MIIDHIGIIVRDLDSAVELWEKIFGVKAVKIQEMPEVGLRIAHIEARNLSVELIQYATDDESFGRRVMGSSPGLNHISILVDNVDEAVRRCKESGARVQDGFPREGSKGRIAFFEPETTGGVLLEVCENKNAAGQD